MRKMFKKAVALALAAVMMIPAMGIGASAKTTSTTVVGTYKPNGAWNNVCYTNADHPIEFTFEVPEGLDFQSASLYIRVKANAWNATNMTLENADGLVTALSAADINGLDVTDYVTAGTNTFYIKNENSSGVDYYDETTATGDDYMPRLVFSVSDPVTITVTEAGEEVAKYEDVEYNQKVTVSETSSDFSYWEKDGEIISYDATYSFYACKDTTVNAVLNGAVENPGPICSLTYDRNGDETEIYVEYTVPSTTTVESINTGLYIAKAAEGWNWQSGTDELIQTSFSQLGQLKVTVTGAGENTFYAQGWCNINSWSYDTAIYEIAA